MSGIGGFVHECVSLDRIEQALRERCQPVVRQARAGPGREGGHIDLLVGTSAGSIAIEVELNSKRVANDLQKASQLGAHELWLVAPATRQVQAIRRQLRRLGSSPSNIEIVVLTLGQALNRIDALFPTLPLGHHK